LEVLNISNNNITDVIYNNASFKSIEKFGINLSGNPFRENVQISTGANLRPSVCFQVCIDSSKTTVPHSYDMGIISYMFSAC
ncbi:hypothetical protein KC19_VG007900, partial [Ceratodon purpureus]